MLKKDFLRSELSKRNFLKRAALTGLTVASLPLFGQANRVLAGSMPNGSRELRFNACFDPIILSESLGSVGIFSETEPVAIIAFLKDIHKSNFLFLISISLVVLNLASPVTIFTFLAFDSCEIPELRFEIIAFFHLRISAIFISGFPKLTPLFFASFLSHLGFLFVLIQSLYLFSVFLFSFWLVFSSFLSSLA